MDRTAAGIVLIAAGVAWIVWYRRLTGPQRDALMRGFSASGIASSASGGSSGRQGSGGATIPGPSPTPWRGMPDFSRYTPSVEDRLKAAWNENANAFRRLWKRTFPTSPLPGGDIPNFPTPPIVPGRGGY